MCSLSHYFKRNHRQISRVLAERHACVMGGGYTGFTVDKKLVIIGAGTGMGIGEGVQVNGIVTVLDAADSTELRSLWIRASANSSRTRLRQSENSQRGDTHLCLALFHRELLYNMEYSLRLGRSRGKC